MRAEYKVPGGKLLVCEVSVEKGVVKHGSPGTSLCTRRKP